MSGRVAHVYSHEDLSALSTWIAERPELADSGLVTHWVDDKSDVFGVLWAGPPAQLLEDLLAESRRRGVEVVVRPVKYSFAELDKAMDAIWSAQVSSAALGFGLQAVSGTNLERAGILVGGVDLRDLDGDTELDGHLAALVHTAVMQLPGVCGCFASGDIGVERRSVRF